MIKQLSLSDAKTIYAMVNEAAQAYKGVIPADCFHEPYMPEEELLSEMGVMAFYGWEEDDKVVGVMGFQPVKDVTLIRHAYVLPAYQKRGVGAKLLEHIRRLTMTQRLLVGTWADASWAIKFYQKHGFRLLPDKERLLQTYWNISPRQIETSVVLGTTKET